MKNLHLMFKYKTLNWLHFQSARISIKICFSIFIMRTNFTSLCGNNFHFFTTIVLLIIIFCMCTFIFSYWQIFLWVWIWILRIKNYSFFCCCRTRTGLVLLGRSKPPSSGFGVAVDVERGSTSAARRIRQRTLRNAGNPEEGSCKFWTSFRWRILEAYWCW